MISEGPDGEIRYIEVKGRAAVGEVELSEREWLTAENLGERYWLYVVTHATSKPQIHVIQDPVRHLNPEGVQRRTRYQVSVEAWQLARKAE